LDAAANKWGNTLLALTSKQLKLQSYFTVEGGASKGGSDLNQVTPVVFEYKDKDVVASVGADGRLYLHDPHSLGGSDHKTALSQTPVIAAAGGGVWGGLTSWEDADGVRFVAAPVWGPVSPELKAPGTNGPTPNGAVVAFKVEDQGGKPALVPAWVSRDLSSPVPPVTTNGVVFALSTGDYTRQGSEMRAKASSHAVFYGLDGATGKEMYTTGKQVTSPANLTGMSVANGRVYFTTNDGTLYAFGIFMETIEEPSPAKK
jgi:hypothetical protein